MEIWINGFQYYADIQNKILYLDRDKINGTPFSFLTKNEMDQINKELKFPKINKNEVFTY